VRSAINYAKSAECTCVKKTKGEKKLKMVIEIKQNDIKCPIFNCGAVRKYTSLIGVAGRNMTWYTD
jgi:hypothetical protein